MNFLNYESGKQVIIKHRGVRHHLCSVILYACILYTLYSIVAIIHDTARGKSST